MRGTYFQKPLELKLEIPGESWQQGDTISGKLTIKNHSADAQPITGIQVSLAHGTLKKVREKSPDAFKIFETVHLAGPEDSAKQIDLGGQGERSLDWTFKTDQNCPITDTSSSLFVLCGDGSQIEKMGTLQLQIKPDATIEEFLSVFQARFRFVLKHKKARKAGVEAKLEPPTAKEYAAIEYLNLIFNFDDEKALLIEFSFHAKKLEAKSGAQIEAKKVQREFSVTLTPQEYKLSSGRFNDVRMESAIAEILALVTG